MAKAAKITVTPTDAPLFGRTDTERWAVQAGNECLYVSTSYRDAMRVQWTAEGDAARARAEAAPSTPRRRRTPWNKGLQTSSWQGLNRMQRI